MRVLIVANDMILAVRAAEKFDKDHPELVTRYQCVWVCYENGAEFGCWRTRTQINVRQGR